MKRKAEGKEPKKVNGDRKKRFVDEDLDGLVLQEPKEEKTARPAARGSLDSRMMVADLRRWRTVALKALASGKKRRGFTSEHIPSSLKRALVEWLDHATEKEDVAWAFRSVTKARRPLVAVRRRIRLERRMKAAAQAYFREIAGKIASLIAGEYGSGEMKGEKVDDPKPDCGTPGCYMMKITGGPTDDQIDGAMAWEKLIEALKPIIYDAYLDAETLAADAAGVDIAYGLTDEQATAYATKRAAELVGKRVLEDGSVVDNPNARWSIPESVRDRLRQTIAKAFEEGWTEAKLQEEIESPRFWSWRSEMIARTEVATALNRGTVDAYKEGGVESVIIHDGAGCLMDGHDDDQEGVDGEEWPIEQFNEYPIGHPNCRRDAVPVLPED